MSTPAGVTVRPDGPVPVTNTLSVPSSSVSSVGVRVNVAVPLGAFAGIVRVNVAGDAVKSVPDVAVPEPTDTVTAVAEPRVPSFRVPVTVMEVPVASSSFTDSGLTESATRVDGASSSVTDTVTAGAAKPA